MWFNEFNLLGETITIDEFKYGNEVDFMDLFVFKGENFLDNGKFDISVIQKEENNICIFQRLVDTKHIP